MMAPQIFMLSHNISDIDGRYKNSVIVSDLDIITSLFIRTLVVFH